ncbi:hypothetical protein JXA63_00005 [Candidatus Woesebacteria bacterium]|nr:hypothetical protein [Candidatus Woesebacteria bacterium]
MSRDVQVKELKAFINSFNYPDPSWENLPNGFPNCDTRGLTPQEEGLFSGIQLIWYANHGGRQALYRRFAQSMVLFIAMVASGIMLRNILVSDMFGRVVEVNAATVSGTLRSLSGQSFEDRDSIFDPTSILESTVSGLMRSK